MSAVERGEAIASAAGCAGEGQPACLRSLSPEDLLVATEAGSEDNILGLPGLGPNVDGAVLPALPYDMVETGAVADVPIVSGSNADEMALFSIGLSVPTVEAYEALIRSALGALADGVLAIYPADVFDTPKDAYIALTSDLVFICPALSFVEMASGGDEPAYAYHFTRELVPALGAFHGLEIFYVFGALDAAPAIAGPEDLELSEAMMAAWIEVGRGTFGEPWVPYDEAAPSITIFDDPLSSASSIREGRCEELRALGLLR
jgi:para-nitrobenzyl esterase